MALVSCPECNHQVSGQASACPNCGHPLHVAQGAPQHAGPPICCSQCGGSLKKGADAKSEGSGCLIALVGLLLAPILIGIPIILIGVHMMGKREGFWRCKKCGAKFPREIKWYQFG
jgi:predicted nucleic acid-binding Zn ribbon protein